MAYCRHGNWENVNKIGGVLDLHTFFEIIGLIFTVVGSIWVYEQYNQRRIDKIWTRMDEKQKLYFETFLKKEIYDNDQKHIKELSEEKNGHLLQFFSDKFLSLEMSVKEVKDTLKGMNNNHEQR